MRLAAFCLVAVACSGFVLEGAERPNILWLTSEDHGPHMGCYGDAIARTPNVDALAARGMRFSRAWSCAPVCAPARTTIITGLYATSLAAEHMRSEVPLPLHVVMFPKILRAAGYYCSNNRKEDYNLAQSGRVWDDSSGRAHWRQRAPGQPFFAVFNSMASHESQIRKHPHKQGIDPARVRVPAYHPDTPEVRQDWAQYYDQVSQADADAGRRLAELAHDGLADDTIVFYFADHGSGMPRSKRWLGNSGLQVPMVVYFPEKWRHLAPAEYRPGGQSNRLVGFADLAPTVVSLAGVRPPGTMQGHAFAGPFQEKPPEMMYGFRGRMDERPDLVRSVTDGRYVYLRNYLTHLPHGQHVSYQFETPTTRIWRRLYEEHRLNEAQSRFWQVPRAPEELYDLNSDPDEVCNLANSPEYARILDALRQAQRNFAAQIRDTGFLPEAEVHARSGDRSPRDALAGDDAYPFARVFAAAERASSNDGDRTSELERLLADRDSGVRYWGAQGACMQGRAAFVALRVALLKALNDPSPSVRIAAAAAIGRFGDGDDLDQSLATLKENADPTRSGAYAAVAAMNAIDQLGEKASPLVEFVRTMPTNDPKAVARANGYVSRLREMIIERASARPDSPGAQR